jgi:hypothetical protein
VSHPASFDRSEQLPVKSGHAPSRHKWGRAGKPQSFIAQWHRGILRIPSPLSLLEGLVMVLMSC